MDILENIQSFFKNLNKQDFLKFLSIFFAAITGIFALMIYLHYYRVSSYLEELDKAKSEVEKTVQIIKDHKKVVQQNKQVDDILKKTDKNFRIVEAFENISKKLNLESKREATELLATEGTIIADKVEQKLTIKFNGINTKDLTNLLKEIAKIERLYPKELSINKNKDNKTINIEITVATLNQVTKK